MYKKLMDVMPIKKKFGMGISHGTKLEKLKIIADKVDKSVSTVREQISLLNLPNGIKKFKEERRG